MLRSLKNYDSHFIIQEIEKYNFKINVIPKTIEKYMSFTIHQPKRKVSKPGLSLVYIDRVHFLNNSSDNLVKRLGENDFYHPSQEFNTKILDLLTKKDFYLITTGIALKNSKKAYPAKINFIIH